MENSVSNSSFDVTQVDDILSVINEDLNPVEETNPTPEPEVETPETVKVETPDQVKEEDLQPEENINQEETKSEENIEDSEQEKITPVIENPMKHLRDLHKEDSRIKRQQEQKIKEQQEEINKLQNLIENDRPQYNLEDALAGMAKIQNGELTDIDIGLVRKEIHKHTPEEMEQVLLKAGRGDYGELSDDILQVANQFQSSVNVANKERLKRSEELKNLSENMGAFSKLRAQSISKVLEVIPDLEKLESDDARLYAETTLEFQKTVPDFVDNNPLAPEIILKAMKGEKYYQVASRLEAENKELRDKLTLMTNPQSGLFSSANVNSSSSSSSQDADRELLDFLGTHGI